MQLLAPLIGLGISTVYFGLLALPALGSILILTHKIRYREWLGVVLLLLAALYLTLCGDYIYNLTHMTASRGNMSLGFHLICSGVMLANPITVAVVIFRNSAFPKIGAVVMTGLLVAAGFQIRATYRGRVARDIRDTLRDAVVINKPGTFIHGLRIEQPGQNLIRIQGHVPETTPVTFLSNPMVEPFKARIVRAVAGVYHPRHIDPAVPSNFTEVRPRDPVENERVYDIGLIQTPVTSYHAIPMKPTSRKGTTEVHGPGGVTVFLTPVPELKPPPNAFPCKEQSLRIGLRSPDEAKMVLPSCALIWNTFELNNQLYLMARTQAPTPPGREAMDPDWTVWLLRFSPDTVTQIWPEP